MKKRKPNPAARAWRQWISSPVGKRCLLGDSGGYLRERLRLAFGAGAKSGTTNTGRGAGEDGK